MGSLSSTSTTNYRKEWLPCCNRQKKPLPKKGANRDRTLIFLLKDDPQIKKDVNVGKRCWKKVFYELTVQTKPLKKREKKTGRWGFQVQRGLGDDAKYDCGNRGKYEENGESDKKYRASGAGSAPTHGTHSACDKLEAGSALRHTHSGGSELSFQEEEAARPG